MSHGVTVFVHATAVVVGPCGVLIEGPSGSGKSALAAALIAQAGVDGRCCLLVGDDRIGLTAVAGRLLARPHEAIAGLLERRGVGLVRVENEPACLLHLAVCLHAAEHSGVSRLPDRPPAIERLGIALPRLDIAGGVGPFEAAQTVLARLPRSGIGFLEALQSAC